MMTFGWYMVASCQRVFYVCTKQHGHYVWPNPTDTLTLFFKPKSDQVYKHILNMGQNFTPNSNLFSCSALAQNYRFRWCDIWYDLSISFPILHAPNGNKGNDNQSETKTEFDTWNILAFQFTTGKQTKNQHIFYSKRQHTIFPRVYLHLHKENI